MSGLTHAFSLGLIVESTPFNSPVTAIGTSRISINRDSTKGGDIVPIGTNTHILHPSIDVSEVQSILIKSDQDITIKTNSSGSPDDTLAIKAGMPYIWITGKSYDTLKLTVDVASIYVTNTAAANLSIEVLVGAP